jgi:hypothetical protein
MASCQLWTSPSPHPYTCTWKFPPKSNLGLILIDGKKVERCHSVYCLPSSKCPQKILKYYFLAFRFISWFIKLKMEILEQFKSLNLNKNWKCYDWWSRRGQHEEKKKVNVFCEIFFFCIFFFWMIFWLCISKMICIIWKGVAITF